MEVCFFDSVSYSLVQSFGVGELCALWQRYGSSYVAHHGTFNYKYEYLYRIELKTDEEAKAKAILKDGELYFYGENR